MTYDCIITNGTVVTVNSNHDVLATGTVCIADGTIRQVLPGGPANSLPDAGTVLDAGGGIIMPGLVNTHTHLPMTLFRGLADDLPLMTWLSEHIFPAEARHIDPDTVRTGTLLACAEMLLSGTTTCCDGYFYEDHVAKAVRDTGMRAVLGQGIIDFPAPGVPDPSRNVETAVEFVRRWNGASARILPSLFCHSPYTCSPDTIKAAKEKAREAGCLFQIHAAETHAECLQIREKFGTSPIQALDAMGVLDQDTLLVHAIWIDERDIETIAARKSKVTVATQSEMKLASGIAPIARLLEAGVTVGLGTDGSASNNSMDMFCEMDMTAKLHKVHNLDPTVLAASCALALCTIDGARSIGLSELTGSLEVGKRADVIVLDTAKPRLTPLYNPVSHIVYAACGADVRHVLIDGQVLVRDRELISMDLRDILEKGAAAGRRIAGGRRQ